MMSKSQKIGIGVVAGLMIALGLGSGRVVLGQKEANPPQTEKEGAAEALTFIGLTIAERDLAAHIGSELTDVEGMEVKLEALKREARRYSDLHIDISIQLDAVSIGLSAREIDESRRNLITRDENAQVRMKQLHGSLDELLSELSKRKIELFLLTKKNGLPNLTTNPVENPALESIEQTLKAIESKLSAPAAIGK